MKTTNEEHVLVFVKIIGSKMESALWIGKTVPYKIVKTISSACDTCDLCSTRPGIVSLVELHCNLQMHYWLSQIFK